MEIGKPFLADGQWYVFVENMEQCGGCRRTYSKEELRDMKHGCNSCYRRKS
jgi:protein-arginine kinase activator protein McsA